MSVIASIQEEIRQNIEDILTNKCPLSGQKLFYPINLVKQQAEIDIKEALKEEIRIEVTHVGVESRLEGGAKIVIKYAIKRNVIVAELEKQIEELSIKVDEEANKLSDLVILVAGLEGRVTAIETDTTALQTDLASAKNDIAINHDDLIEIDGKIAGQGQLVACHAMAAGVNGGDPSQEDSWTPIPINTITHKSGYLATEGVAFLSGSQIRIPPGKYKIIGRVFGCGVVRFQSAISVNSTIIAIGESIGASKDAFAVGLTLCQISEVVTEVELAVEAMIAIEGIYSHLHSFEASLGVAVFGNDPNIQVPVSQDAEEHYSNITIYRVP